MNFSGLYEKYGGFRKPTFTLIVNGSRLQTGEGARLQLLECELTARRRAGSLFLAAELTPGTDLADTWLRAIQLGAVCSLALGYQGTEEDVFSGFVYDVIWDDPLDGGPQCVELTCLDVRGQLMLAACSDAGAARTLSQMVQTTLQQSCCTRMAPSVKIGAVPADWDLPFQRPGATDFSVLCDAADFLCFEFYAWADTVYFGPPRPSQETAVTFDGPNGLIRLRRRRTLAGQCAAVAVSGADDKGERLYARQPRASGKGFGAGQLGAALTRDLHRAEPAVRTMAQAKYLARARMEDRQRQGGALTGRGTGLPDLRPGRFVAAGKLSEAVNGSYYVQLVRHTVDDTGFETCFEAEE